MGRMKEQASRRVTAVISGEPERDGLTILASTLEKAEALLLSTLGNCEGKRCLFLREDTSPFWRRV